MVHWPSAAIGAGISSAALVATLLVVGGALNEPELRMAPSAQDSAQITMETFLDNGSPVLGSPDAPVTLVEFGDYQCHFCNVFFHSTEKSILKDYVSEGKVKIIFKDYNIIGVDSITASHGAHCADDQGKFWEYHDILYENWTGENNGWASLENQMGFARELGLDEEQWTECVNSQKHSQRILASNADARKLELNSTPSFFVIGPGGDITKIRGAQPYETFTNVFESELQKAGA